MGKCKFQRDLVAIRLFSPSSLVVIVRFIWLVWLVSIQKQLPIVNISQGRSLRLNRSFFSAIKRPYLVAKTLSYWVGLATAQYLDVRSL